MKKKKIIAVIIVSILVVTCFFADYLIQRNSIYKKIANELEIVENSKTKIYSKEYLELINIINSPKLKLNSSLKEIEESLDSLIENKTYAYDENYRNISNLKTISFGDADYVISTKYPNIIVNTNDNCGDTITKETGYVKATITVIYNNECITDNDAQIKIRGNSTATAEKKPFNIKLSEKVDLFGFGAAKKWSLLAECYDPTMLRNKLFFDLAKDMELEYTSESEYVNLWLDGKYLGCYLFVEPVDSGKTRVDVDIDDGDFMFEYERERAEEGATYVVTNKGWRFVLNDPEEPTEDQYEYINNKINELDSVLTSGDWNLVEKEINVESFAKFYVLNEFAKPTDFVYSSVKFYYKDGVFYAGPVWDYDLSSGNVTDVAEVGYLHYWEGYDLANNHDSSKGLYCTENEIFNALFMYDGFMSRVIETFNDSKELFESQFAAGGKLDELLNKYLPIISRNYENDVYDGANWDVSKEYTDIAYKRFETYEENYNYLRSWLSDRYKWIYKEIDKYR